MTIIGGLDESEAADVQMIPFTPPSRFDTRMMATELAMPRKDLRNLSDSASFKRLSLSNFTCVSNLFDLRLNHVTATIKEIQNCRTADNYSARDPIRCTSRLRHDCRLGDIRT